MKPIKANVISNSNNTHLSPNGRSSIWQQASGCYRLLGQQHGALQATSKLTRHGH